MRIFGTISQVTLKATDYNTDKYIGKHIKNLSPTRNVVLLESISTKPKRYKVIVNNRVAAYFLSYAEAYTYFENQT